MSKPVTIKQTQKQKEKKTDKHGKTNASNAVVKSKTVKGDKTNQKSLPSSITSSMFTRIFNVKYTPKATAVN